MHNTSRRVSVDVDERINKSNIIGFKTVKTCFLSKMFNLIAIHRTVFQLKIKINETIFISIFSFFFYSRLFAIYFYDPPYSHFTATEKRNIKHTLRLFFLTSDFSLHFTKLLYKINCTIVSFLHLLETFIGNEKNC